MTYRCPDGIDRQGSPFQNLSNARVMPQKIQLSPRYSCIDSPTNSGEDPLLPIPPDIFHDFITWGFRPMRALSRYGLVDQLVQQTKCEVMTTT